MSLWIKLSAKCKCIFFSGPVLLSHPKANPPEGRGCALLLRKQRHSPYLRHHGPTVPGISLSFTLIGLSISISGCASYNFSFSHTGTSRRRFLPLHRLQWRECVWRIDPKANDPHPLFLPFKTIYRRHAGSLELWELWSIRCTFAFNLSSSFVFFWSFSWFLQSSNSMKLILLQFELISAYMQLCIIYNMQTFPSQAHFKYFWP